MPYKLRKVPKKDLYWVVAEDGTKQSKEGLPLERAKAQMKALYIAMRKKEGGAKKTSVGIINMNRRSQAYARTRKTYNDKKELSKRVRLMIRDTTHIIDQYRLRIQNGEPLVPSELRNFDQHKKNLAGLKREWEKIADELGVLRGQLSQYERTHGAIPPPPETVPEESEESEGSGRVHGGMMTATPSPIPDSLSNTFGGPWEAIASLAGALTVGGGLSWALYNYLYNTFNRNRTQPTPPPALEQAVRANPADFLIQVDQIVLPQDTEDAIAVEPIEDGERVILASNTTPLETVTMTQRKNHTYKASTFQNPDGSFNEHLNPNMRHAGGVMRYFYIGPARVARPPAVPRQQRPPPVPLPAPEPTPPAQVPRIKREHQTVGFTPRPLFPVLPAPDTVIEMTNPLHRTAEQRAMDGQGRRRRGGGPVLTRMRNICPIQAPEYSSDEEEHYRPARDELLPRYVVENVDENIIELERFLDILDNYVVPESDIEHLQNLLHQFKYTMESYRNPRTKEEFEEDKTAILRNMGILGENLATIRGNLADEQNPQRIIRPNILRPPSPTEDPRGTGKYRGGARTYAKWLKELVGHITPYVVKHMTHKYNEKELGPELAHAIQLYFMEHPEQDPTTGRLGPLAKFVVETLDNLPQPELPPGEEFISYIGQGSGSKFHKQLLKAGIQPSAYLKEAQRRAKDAGYPEKLLGFSSDSSHKLAIPDPDGKMIHFGKVGYGDFLIWSHSERAGNVPKGTADGKRRTFQASHTKIKGDWKGNPFSPNNLALKILW